MTWPWGYKPPSSTLCARSGPLVLLIFTLHRPSVLPCSFAPRSSFVPMLFFTSLTFSFAFSAGLVRPTPLIYPLDETCSSFASSHLSKATRHVFSLVLFWRFLAPFLRFCFLSVPLPILLALTARLILHTMFSSLFYQPRQPLDDRQTAFRLSVPLQRHVLLTHTQLSPNTLPFPSNCWIATSVHHS